MNEIEDYKSCVETATSSNPQGCYTIFKAEDDRRTLKQTAPADDVRVRVITDLASVSVYLNKTRQDQSVVHTSNNNITQYDSHTHWLLVFYEKTW